MMRAAQKREKSARNGERQAYEVTETLIWCYQRANQLRTFLPTVKYGELSIAGPTAVHRNAVVGPFIARKRIPARLRINLTVSEG